MSSGEVFGYIASALVFATFYMRTMLPLRVVAIASNIAFITYALVDGLTPILLLHGALLPLNVIRILQIRELMAKVEKAARHEFSAQAIIPFMRERRFRADERLFSVNDPADELYYIVEGWIFLPEVQKEVGPGEFLGEFALFSTAGRRTATALATTDCRVMTLSKKAVFGLLAHQPQLGIHLLKLVTSRLLEDAGLDGKDPTTAAAAAPPRRATLGRRILDRIGPKSRIAIAVALGALPLAAAIHQPLYVVLDRDAAVTSWLNVATAPIDGTVEGFETRVGQKANGNGAVAAIVNHSADRSAVIRAEDQMRRSETRLIQATQYSERVLRLAAEWTERRNRYAEGFRQDLDHEIQDLEQRIVLLKEREALADVSARRKRVLRATGMASQADEDVATSEHRELQTMRTQMVKALDRVRERRRLAGRGVFLQQDGKEPEWSWRSLDEINLEMVRANRAVGDAQEDLVTARAVLAEERSNLRLSSMATVKVPDAMTIWSSAVTNNASVNRGDQLFSWIDCSKKLVDVPVTETLAAILQEGMPAMVTLEGDPEARPATVLLTRGASSRLGQTELASLSRGHKSYTAQVLVAFKDSNAIDGCPIGRRAFVSFPEVRMVQYIRAYMPGL
jgi:CRP/FNR family cyclic AMP-dependent transcriptional regulator